jgi:hypothetical protein
MKQEGKAEQNNKSIRARSAQAGRSEKAAEEDPKKEAK